MTSNYFFLYLHEIFANEPLGICFHCAKWAKTTIWLNVVPKDTTKIFDTLVLEACFRPFLLKKQQQ